MNLNKRHIMPFFLFVSIVLWGQIPTGYYDSVRNKKEAELKTALHNIIKGHTQKNYSASASFFEQNDRTLDGYIWDMYSANLCTQWYGCNLNREHNMPKSWFGIAGGKENSDPIGCDYHNLYPSNASANSRKSNHPLGRTNATPAENDLGKIGKSTISGYNGTVYEPADEYKGDFARNYMYMVTRYEDYSSRWTGIGVKSMLRNNTYPTFNDYAINLLLEWHKNDPVSQKEIDRNNAIYQVQHNRNPFVDRPEYAEYIWAYDPSKEILILNPLVRGEIELSVELNDGEKAYYELYAVSGAMVKKQQLTSNKISVQELNRGMYILIVYLREKRLTSKIIIAGSN